MYSKIPRFELRPHPPTSFPTTLIIFIRITNSLAKRADVSHSSAVPRADKTPI